MQHLIFLPLLAALLGPVGQPNLSPSSALIHPVAEPTYLPCAEMMEHEAPDSGEALSRLHGADFDQAYLQHALRIVQAQQRARARDLRLLHVAGAHDTAQAAGAR